jgi:uncharacterized protein YqeY
MLKERLEQDLKDALRQKDKVRLSAVRMLRAGILEQEKSGSGPATPDQITAIVQRQAKQRRESIKQFEENDREDLAQRERDELFYIEQYLPAQLSDEEIVRRVHEIVQRTGATTMQDMGRVMGEAMSDMRGQADGNRVRQAVQQLLGASS